MDIKFFVSWGLLVIYLVLYIVFAARTGRFKKTVATSVTIGLGAIFLLNITTFLTGIHIPINWWTLGSSAAVGLPGVAALLLLKLIFI